MKDFTSPRTWEIFHQSNKFLRKHSLLPPETKSVEELEKVERVKDTHSSFVQSNTSQTGKNNPETSKHFEEIFPAKTNAGLTKNVVHVDMLNTLIPLFASSWV